MANVTMKGNPMKTYGTLPAEGTTAPPFTLVKTDLTELSLSEFKGKKVVLNIFISLDTSTCANSVRKFNELASGKVNTVVLAISKDLPFAAKRFCTTEGIQNVITLSGFRDKDFGKAYGVEITDSPYKGLYSRSIVVIDAGGKVVHCQQVQELSHEPDYTKALAAL
ncbi:MAG TPA: thiol peroxidase [Bacteroidales bacterium]|nr:thiol peroxidase [Bacteroidales bacterium]